MFHQKRYSDEDEIRVSIILLVRCVIFIIYTLFHTFKVLGLIQLTSTSTCLVVRVTPTSPPVPVTSRSFQYLSSDHKWSSYFFDKSLH